MKRTGMKTPLTAAETFVLTHLKTMPVKEPARPPTPLEPGLLPFAVRKSGQMLL